MKRLLVPLAWLAFVVAMTTRCDSTTTPVNLDASGTPPNASPMASVRGTVTMGGSALGGAQVILNGPIWRTVTAEADGRFTFADVPPGFYLVGAISADVLCESVTAHIKARETIDVGVRCASAQPPQPRSIGAMSGAVTAGGAPLNGVLVTLTGLSFTGSDSAQTVLTDTSGRFSFSELASGTYTVTVTASGFLCVFAVVKVEPDRTVTANISCAEDRGGSGGGPPPPSGSLSGRIAFERDGRIMIVDPYGSHAFFLVDGLAPSWSRDGSKIVFQRPGCLDRSEPPGAPCDDVWIVRSDGSGLAPVTSYNWVMDSDPVFSPDGSKVAFVRFLHGLDDTFIVVANVDPPSPLWSEAVLSAWWPYSRPAWSPDGQRIAFTCQGPPPRWEFDICVVESNRIGTYSDFANGNFSRGLRKITNDTWTDTDPAWSPDGKWIAFSTNRDATDGRSYIALMAPDGSGFTRLVPGRRPTWSPDGTRIAFVGEADAPGLYVVNGDGSGLVRITDDPADTAPSWGP